MNKFISLDEFRKEKKQKEKDKANQPIMGYMVWLFCPNCKSLEYSEVRANFGRVHLCGTNVEEYEVELDFRTELTITLANIKLIESLLEKKKKFSIRALANGVKETYKLLLTAEKQYAHRLQLATYNYHQTTPLKPYESIDNILKNSIADTTPMGLYISTFRYKPEKHFLS